MGSFRHLEFSQNLTWEECVAALVGTCTSTYLQESFIELENYEDPVIDTWWIPLLSTCSKVSSEVDPNWFQAMQRWMCRCLFEDNVNQNQYSGCSWNLGTSWICKRSQNNTFTIGTQIKKISDRHNEKALLTNSFVWEVIYRSKG